MAMNSSTKFYSLFGSVFFLFAGYGLFLNSAGVKLAQMGVNNIAIGALNAAFFVGAALSAVVAHRIVSRVGHIRSFSVFGAVFAMAALGHMMMENLWLWAALRILLGFCYFSILMVVESWFTERSLPRKRAKVLAIYNVVYYVAFTAGIALLSLKLSSSNIFTLAAILVMAAMLPVGLTKIAEPALPPRQRISLPHLLAIAPLALVGSFLAGIMVNGFFTMSSVFLLQQGFNLQQISLYLMLAMLGGFVVQFPVARLSNRYGRRNIILLWAVLAAAFCWAARASMRSSSCPAVTRSPDLIARWVMAPCTWADTVASRTASTCASALLARAAPAGCTVKLGRGGVSDGIAGGCVARLCAAQAAQTASASAAVNKGMDFMRAPNRGFEKSSKPS